MTLIRSLKLYNKTLSNGVNNGVWLLRSQQTLEDSKLVWLVPILNFDIHENDQKGDMPQFLQISFNLFEAICLTEKLIKSMKLEIHF